MKRLIVSGLLGFASAFAAPFLGTVDESANLEKLLQTQFCQEYGCRFKQRLEASDTLQYDFSLRNGATLTAEHFGRYGVIALLVTLPNRPMLSKNDLKLLSSLSNLAAGRSIAFDYKKVCRSSPAAPAKDFGKVGEFSFYVQCGRSSSGSVIMKAWWPG